MRKILAVWAAKLSAAAGIILGKKSSSGPGAIALKICPDLIKRLSKGIRHQVIVTCGTNGKTTTNNLLYSALKNNGHKVVCNTLGANMLTGVATAFAMDCDWLGRLKADYACLEVDEAYTIKVFEHIQPDIVVVTNLFRDQLDRYGEIEMTVGVMKKAFENAGFPKLVLNCDDPVTAAFGRGYNGDVYYYGISEAVLPQKNSAEDGLFCSVCGGRQEYEFMHYSQLGKYFCTHCGNKRPEPDYNVTDVDLSDGISFSVNGHSLKFNYKGFYNIYNVVSVYSALDVIGKDVKGFERVLDGYRPQIGRMQEFDLGKPFILNLAKNPAGFNQAIETVMQDKRMKDIIIAVNDKPSDGTDVSWLWDVAFEQLAASSVSTISVLGSRRYDLALRFKYDDIKVNIITEDMKSVLESCAISSKSEACYVLVNYTMLFSTENILNELKKEREGH